MTVGLSCLRQRARADLAGREHRRRDADLIRASASPSDHAVTNSCPRPMRPQRPSAPRRRPRPCPRSRAGGQARTSKEAGLGRRGAATGKDADPRQRASRAIAKPMLDRAARRRCVPRRGPPRAHRRCGGPCTRGSRLRASRPPPPGALRCVRSGSGANRPSDPDLSVRAGPLSSDASCRRGSAAGPARPRWLRR